MKHKQANPFIWLWLEMTKKSRIEITVAFCKMYWLNYEQKFILKTGFMQFKINTKHFQIKNCMNFFL